MEVLNFGAIEATLEVNTSEHCNLGAVETQPFVLNSMHRAWKRNLAREQELAVQNVCSKPWNPRAVSRTVATLKA
jgi:hypothetical protein